MNITEVRVNKVAVTEGKLRGYAEITLDNEFVVHSIKIIEGEKGLFVAMPSRKDKEDKFKDIVHPITSDARTAIHDAILAEYNK